MYIKARARIDEKTKRLVKRLRPGEIAIIDHPNLDEIAARSLLDARVKAVVNASPSLSDDYPNPGPAILVRAGVLLLDSAGERVMREIEEGQTVEIVENRIYVSGKFVAAGQVLTLEQIEKKMAETRARMGIVLSKFVRNTLEYAGNEIGLITGEYRCPQLKTDLKGKHVLIVVRGHNYKEDLNAIKSYIKEVKPVLIGVDGGGDALLEAGFKPDIIVGDMDSISDRTLRCGAELVVHAYPDGRAPGLQRLKEMGLEGVIFAAPGTSEDIAMLLAYEHGAELIVAVGTHSNIMDFLEKGRKGMASTFLVRLKVGSVLVDAKGVSQLYRSPVRAVHLASLFLAALLPTMAIAFISPSTRELLRLLYIHLRILVGI